MVSVEVAEHSEYVLAAAALVLALLANALLPLDLFASGLLTVLLLALAGVALVPGAWARLYRATGIGAAAWLVGLGVAAGGIGLTYAVGDPQPFCEGIQHRGCLTAYGWASIGYLGASLAAAIAAGHAGRYRRIRAASAEPAAEVEEGLVAVEGRVEPLAEPVSAPVSGERAAWYRSAVEEPHPLLADAHLQTDAEAAGDAFYVADGSGKLLVYPERIDAHDAAQLLRSESSEEDGWRQREWRVEPDDAVAVVGRASDVSRAEHPEPVAVGVDGPVVLGRRTYDELRRWAAQRAVVGGGLALALGVPALAVMVLTAT